MVRTLRCGRSNLGSNPGPDKFWRDVFFSLVFTLFSFFNRLIKSSCNTQLFYLLTDYKSSTVKESDIYCYQKKTMMQFYSFQVNSRSVFAW